MPCAQDQGDQALFPVEPVSTDAGLGPLLREDPLLLDSQDRAICFSQSSIRIPRQEATRVLLANDGGNLCLSTLIGYGLSPSSESCGYDDGGPCSMGAHPRASRDLFPWPLLVLLWLRRRA